MKKILICLLFSTACGKHKEKETTNPTKALEAKYETYLNLIPTQIDEYGFIDGFNNHDRCDSLLWTSLYGVAGGSVDINQAEVQPGEFERNPSGTCTSISRDMLIGVFHYIWHTHNLNMIEAMIDYGEGRGFEMNSQSEGDGANILTPDLIATMYEMRYRLGGADSVARYFAQSFWFGNQTGYLAHIQDLHILLRGLMIGSVTDNELELLKQHSMDNPQNAVYAAIYHKFSDGIQDQAINSLMNETLFPSNSLPTSSNYCADPYLFERDSNTVDWQPCPEENYTHSGVDFEFASAITLNKVN